MTKINQLFVVKLSLAAVFASLVFVVTLLIRVPVPATGGYINFGDTLIFISALLFGPWVGALAGGIGSAVADVVGYPIFAPFTLIIKGLEGLLTGIITNRKNVSKDLIGCLVGGVIMICGYFITEAYILMLGVPIAVVEIPGNISQMLVGILIGVPLVQLVRRRLNFITNL